MSTMTGPAPSAVGLLGSLLVSLQLTDSAFPSGFYTLSHSLEGFAAARAVTAQSLPELLTDLLRHGAGPSDATALVLAHRAAGADDWPAVVEVDQRLHAAKLNRELRLASTRTGRQLLDIAGQVVGGPLLERLASEVASGQCPGSQAAVAGVVYAASGVDADRAVVGDLFAFAASFAGAALRLRLTDHVRAQVLLRAAAPVIEEVAAAALDAELADLGGCVPLADVMSARHERAEARLFMT